MTIVICEDQEKVNIFIAEAFLVSDVYTVMEYWQPQSVE